MGEQVIIAAIPIAISCDHVSLSCHILLPDPNRFYRLKPALPFRRDGFCARSFDDQSEGTYVSSLVRGFVRFRVEDDTFANAALRKSLQVLQLIFERWRDFRKGA